MVALKKIVLPLAMFAIGAFCGITYTGMTGCSDTAAVATTTAQDTTEEVSTTTDIPEAETAVGDAPATEVSAETTGDSEAAE